MGRLRDGVQAGETFVPEKTQREILRDVLLNAAESSAWLTLNQLAEKTSYAQASISAQLRHLRKQQYGGWLIEKRRSEAEETHCATKRERVYEYQLKRSKREINPPHSQETTAATNAM
jgi:DNA-binding MarR family transcriptional regulator